MKYSIALSLLFILTVFASCKKDQAKTDDYFEDLTSSHLVKESCGFADVYVTISDTSCIGFHLRDGQLNIDTTGTTMEVSDLIDWNNVYYYAWNNEEDHVAPVFCGCVVPWNMSEFEKWELTVGTLIASVSKMAEDRESTEMYEMSIHLKDAVFDRSESEMSTVNIPSVIVKDVPVGWYLG